MLLEDMKKEPREIDESKFLPKVQRKDNTLLRGGEKRYKTRLELRDEYFDQYE